MVIVGGDRGDLSVRHRDPRIESCEFQMLLVFFRAVVTAREREDQWIIALKLTQLAQGTRVIGKFVVGENASGHDIRTHELDSLPAFFLIRNAASFLGRSPTPAIEFIDVLVTSWIQNS
jgi:ABC-type uncharacterized transport system permease subunit